jgi:hypothetical protein
MPWCSRRSFVSCIFSVCMVLQGAVCGVGMLQCGERTMVALGVGRRSGDGGSGSPHAAGLRSIRPPLAWGRCGFRVRSGDEGSGFPHAAGLRSIRPPACVGTLRVPRSGWKRGRAGILLRRRVRMLAPGSGRPGASSAVYYIMVCRQGKLSSLCHIRLLGLKKTTHDGGAMEASTHHFLIHQLSKQSSLIVISIWPMTQQQSGLKI